MIQNEAHQSARKHGLQGEQRLDDALHAAGGDHPPRPGGNIKRSPLELLCTWILEVRRMISDYVVIVKRTAIVNLLDTIEDHLLWDDAIEVEAAEKAAGNANSLCINSDSKWLFSE